MGRPYMIPIQFFNIPRSIVLKHWPVPPLQPIQNSCPCLSMAFPTSIIAISTFHCLPALDLSHTIDIGIKNDGYTKCWKSIEGHSFAHRPPWGLHETSFHRLLIHTFLDIMARVSANGREITCPNFLGGINSVIGQTCPIGCKRLSWKMYHRMHV